jgi:cell wall-associated NlpC family hydrolase
MRYKLLILIILITNSLTVFAGEGDVPTGLSAPAVNAETSAEAAAPAGNGVVFQALALIDVDYKRGGRVPLTGLDCSGLVRYVYQQARGVELPNTALELSRVGTKVGRGELKPGDLVFYHTLRKAFSHVGIYLGDNRFIHAPSTGGAVRIDDMTMAYWAKRFNGARRIISE